MSAFRFLVSPLSPDCLEAGYSSRKALNLETNSGIVFSIGCRFKGLTFGEFAPSHFGLGASYSPGNVFNGLGFWARVTH